MFSSEERALYLPRKYRDLIKHGNDWDGDPTTWANLTALPHSEGTCGRAYQYDPGLALRLTQVLVTQGFSDSEITRMHLSAYRDRSGHSHYNMGFLWVRRQDDPQAASAGLIAQCARGRKLMLSTRQRHARIAAMLATGEVVYQKRLVAHVGNALDSYTRRDLDELEQAGAIRIEHEQHGKVTWKRISLCVPLAVFWDISYTIRKALARTIAKAKAVLAKGCKRLSLDRRGYRSTTPSIDYEQLHAAQSRTVSLADVLALDPPGSIRVHSLTRIPHQSDIRRVWFADTPEVPLTFEQIIRDLAGEQA